MKALTFSVNVPQYLSLKAIGMINRKAYYQGRLATVRYAEVPEPGLPGPDWVRIKTRMCGFCASDLNMIFLRDSPTASPFTSFPSIMGHEFCGTIIEKGANVGNAAVGDRVTAAPQLPCEARGISPACPQCQAGHINNCENYAEGKLVPGLFLGVCREAGGGFAPYLAAHKSQIFVLPEHVPDTSGALIEPLSVALQAVFDNKPELGDNVLVIGGGVIGGMIVRAIRALDIDCRIIVSEPSPFHAEAIRSAGADEIIGDGDLFSHAVRMTGAKRYKPLLGNDILMGGFSRIFDVVGNSATLNSAMRCMSAGGTLSVVGIGHNVSLDLTPLWLKHQKIRGVYSSGYLDTAEGKKHAFALAVELVAGGKINLDGMVTHRFALDDYARMIETNLAKNAHQAIKTVVVYA